MKIGILTFANVANFGANLQALSTTSWLRNNGHDAIVIDWSPDDFYKKFQSSTTQQALEHYRFFDENIPHSKRIVDEKGIADFINKENIEAIIVGSDAVLQHFPFLSRFHCPTRTIVRVDQISHERVFPNAFWGTFMRYVKKEIPIALMSASSQNSRYFYTNPYDIFHMRKLLKRFSYVSVRDKWTGGMLRYVSLGSIRPSITPDPVFAFNQNITSQLCKNEICTKYKLPEKYVLFSFKDPKNVNYEWLKEIKDKFESKGYVCVALPMPTGVMFKHPFDYEIPMPLNPMDWYFLIKYASGYIGENMHPIVVSLHNATPFFCFDNYGVVWFRLFRQAKSSKIYDIISRFGLLENRASLGCHVQAKDVVDKILNFDKDKCRIEANKRLDEYNHMMNTIIHSLKNHQ